MDEQRDKAFRDIIWSALIMLVRAFGRRYGYCYDIEIVKNKTSS
jgi:hypothetical protein